MKTSMRAARLKRGVLAAMAAGLALGSLVLASTASAAVKLPTERRGEALRRQRDGDGEHPALPALQPVGQRATTSSISSTTIQTAGTGSGTGISDATERHHRHRGVRRLPVAAACPSPTRT